MSRKLTHRKYKKHVVAAGLIQEGVKLAAGLAFDTPGIASDLGIQPLPWVWAWGRVLLDIGAFTRSPIHTIPVAFTISTYIPWYSWPSCRHFSLSRSSPFHLLYTFLPTNLYCTSPAVPYFLAPFASSRNGASVHRLHLVQYNPNLACKKSEIAVPDDVWESSVAYLKWR